ncbi:uncharacterized protein G2W53_041893 [Senna tora]|uniref:Uncharacterized protein n=1 Tax=Senna tora TaxID=362788 RepID=A0A834SG23_9FABA|nr:uncharacterized protein G2W53_041893 [Senna tora]
MYLLLFFFCGRAAFVTNRSQCLREIQSSTVTVAAGRRRASGLPPREGRALHLGFFMGKASRFPFFFHLRSTAYFHHRRPMNTAYSGSSRCDSEKTLDPFFTASEHFDVKNVVQSFAQC